MVTLWVNYNALHRCPRVIFIKDHIPERPDRSLLIGIQTSKWSLWDVVFHENDSKWKIYVLLGKVILKDIFQ